MTFNYDTKIASFDILSQMHISEESLDTYPSLLGEVLTDTILAKNHFLYSRYVIIALFNDVYEVVRGQEFVSSFLHLVNNVKRFTKSSAEERMVKQYSFDYSLVFIKNEEELETLKGCV